MKIYTTQDGIELCGLLWDTENLVIKGKEYFTFDEAQWAAATVCKRLPTPEEWEQLCALGSTWDDERKGRWFGGNHDTDHEGSLFLPAAGCRDNSSCVLNFIATYGCYWAAVPYLGTYNVHFGFSPANSYPLYIDNRAYNLCIRLVRDLVK